MAALAFAWGLALYLTFDPNKSSDDGGLLLVGSFMLALFAFVSRKAGKVWNEKVLFRRAR